MHGCFVVKREEDWGQELQVFPFSEVAKRFIVPRVLTAAGFSPPFISGLIIGAAPLIPFASPRSPTLGPVHGL